MFIVPFNNRKAWLLIGLIFLVKLAIAWWLQDHIQAFEVHDIALNMIETGEMEYHVHGQVNYNYQFPVYPTLLFGLYTIFGQTPMVSVVLNLFLVSVCGFLLYKLAILVAARALFNSNGIELISILILLLFLLHPMISYYAMFAVHPFSLDLLLCILPIYITFRFLGNYSFKYFLLFAGVLGIAILDRSTLISTAVPFGWGCWKQFGARRAIAMFALCGIIASIPTGLWVARNYGKYQALSINSSFGKNMWLGLQERSGGTAYLPGRHTYYGLLSTEEWHAIFKMDPLEQSQYFLEKYRRLAHANPTLVVKMYVQKLRNFWWFQDELGAGYGDIQRAFIPLYQLFYGLILILALGFTLYTRGISLLILSLPITLSLIHAVLYVETRHRVVTEPFLMLLAAMCVVMLLNKWRGMRDKWQVSGNK